jgi:GH15 family glucan-1,4-alpha-glucosidase
MAVEGEADAIPAGHIRDGAGYRDRSELVSRFNGVGVIMAYHPIENYGIVGDLHTVALVAENASIDFMCFPHFDSPTIFAGVLDQDKAAAAKSIQSSSRCGTNNSTCQTQTFSCLFFFPSKELPK